MSKHLYSSENQPKQRKPRGPDRRTLLLNAISDVTGKDENAFYSEVVRRAMNPEDPASAQLMKEVLGRMYPASRPTMPVIEFAFRKAGTPPEKVEDISNAVADGILPADVAKLMVDIIKSGLDIIEITDLADRLERLEQQINEKAAQ